MIKLLILDIDGVMTTGQKTYDTEGHVISKNFNDKDFTAIKRFKASGVTVVALSGDSNINQVVLEKRNVHFYLGRTERKLDKESFVSRFQNIYNISPMEMAYIGDDLFDLPIMSKVRYAFCPIDAIQDVKDFVGLSNILYTGGGEGVLAELFQRCKELSLLPISNVSLGTVLELDSLEK